MIAKTKRLKSICKEYFLIENYEQALNDKENKWVLHHRREVQDGFQIWTQEELIKIGQYYHRPANELIFLKQSEHRSLHNNAIDPHTKRPISEKISITKKGEKLSEETRKKMSIAKKGLAPWSKGVTGAEFTKHYKDGVKNQYTKKSEKEE